MVVSYGGHGGGKAALQLKSVLEGVRMRVARTTPGLCLKGEVLQTAVKGGELRLDGDGAIWGQGEREEIVRAFEELLVLLEGKRQENGP